MTVQDVKKTTAFSTKVVAYIACAPTNQVIQRSRAIGPHSLRFMPATYLAELRLLSRSEAVLLDMMPVGTTRLLSELKSMSKASLLALREAVTVSTGTEGLAAAKELCK